MWIISRFLCFVVIDHWQPKKNMEWFISKIGYHPCLLMCKEIHPCVNIEFISKFRKLGKWALRCKHPNLLMFPYNRLVISVRYPFYWTECLEKRGVSKRGMTIACKTSLFKKYHDLIKEFIRFILLILAIITIHNSLHDKIDWLGRECTLCFL